jgi:hypothetical protein
VVHTALPCDTQVDHREARARELLEEMRTLYQRALDCGPTRNDLRGALEGRLANETCRLFLRLVYGPYVLFVYCDFRHDLTFSQMLLQYKASRLVYLVCLLQYFHFFLL